MPPNEQQPVYQQPSQPAPMPAFAVVGSSPAAPVAPVAPSPAGAPNMQINQNPQTKPNTPKKNSTQNSLLLSELRENMIIMGDGSFRAVVACQSINFDLMSSREREGVEFSYQNFLNALYFPIQIFIRSQRVDIGPYIDKLEGIRRTQDNMLLGVLMDDYIQFIDMLSQEANIMDKSFFIVVPYFPNGDLSSVVEQGKGFFGKLFSGPGNDSGVTKIDKLTYEKARDEIRNRVDSVIGGLAQVGVNAVQLKTKEIGELYYNVYNPDTAVREPLGDFTQVTSTYVRKGQNPATPGMMPPEQGAQNG